jgi:HSP20 family protein
MPHSRHRTWIDIQKKHAGLHHPEVSAEHEIGWIPNADVIEMADGVLVRLELAGVAPDSLQIAATRSAVMISGHRANPHTGSTAAGYRFRQMEIEYGAFERVLPLPFPIDPHHVQARCGNGLLEIHLPRARQALTRKTVIHLQW